MPGRDADIRGFEERTRALPKPDIEVDAETRKRLANLLVAVRQGATPEDVADFLDGDFPPYVVAELNRPGEQDEVNDHVDLLLTVFESMLARS